MGTEVELEDYFQAYVDSNEALIEAEAEIERLHGIMREINRACIDGAYDSDALIRAEALTRPFVLAGRIKDGSG